MNRRLVKCLHNVSIAIAVILFFPHAADAHLVTTGLGPVYDGIGHLVLSVDDLIPVMALALLAGQRGPKSGRWTLFILPIAWLIGGLFGMQAKHETEFPFQCISFIIIGILVATNLPLPAPIIAIVAIVLGIAHGYANGTAIQDAGKAAGLLEFIGIMVSLFVIVTLLAALVISLRWDWTKIVVRVAGSWVFAIGLLLLGWALKSSQVIQK
ncbi:MAG TPA: HupE/UreJ family protein [Tepidisphaeraceae bacterium]|nr:HupE/UreJ family protein [Tepidisphaeraceae bacterium]